MPRAKEDQLTAEQREHVEMVEASLINLGVPKREAYRRARLTISDAPSRRHDPNTRNAAAGSRVTARAPKPRTTEAAKRRASPAARKPKRISVRTRPVGA